MTSPLLELNELRFAWPQQPVLLDIVHFRLQAGERLFLKGPSGSGKTTLLGLLGGVHLPQQGEVTLLGQSLASLSARQRDRFRAEHTGYIFQMFNLLPYLSVQDNVLLPCRFSARRKDRALQRHGSLEAAAAHLLNGLGLSDPALLRRPATALSIGQQQRVAAARALIGNPELVIADEPTSALDADSREAFLQLLFAECSEAGSSLLFVSHDTALAPLFDRSLALPELNRATHLEGL